VPQRGADFEVIAGKRSNRKAGNRGLEIQHLHVVQSALP
jgi:hypothetical protein